MTVTNDNFRVNAYGIVTDGEDYVRRHYERALSGACPMSRTGNGCRNPTCRFKGYVGTVGHCLLREVKNDEANR